MTKRYSRGSPPPSNNPDAWEAGMRWHSRTLGIRTLVKRHEVDGAWITSEDPDLHYNDFPPHRWEFIGYAPDAAPESPRPTAEQIRAIPDGARVEVEFDTTGTKAGTIKPLANGGVRIAFTGGDMGQWLVDGISRTVYHGLKSICLLDEPPAFKVGDRVMWKFSDPISACPATVLSREDGLFIIQDDSDGSHGKKYPTYPSRLRRPTPAELSKHWPEKSVPRAATRADIKPGAKVQWLDHVLTVSEEVYSVGRFGSADNGKPAHKLLHEDGRVSDFGAFNIHGFTLIRPAPDSDKPIDAQEFGASYDIESAAVARDGAVSGGGGQLDELSPDCQHEGCALQADPNRGPAVSYCEQHGMERINAEYHERERKRIDKIKAAWGIDGRTLNGVSALLCPRTVGRMKR